MKGFLFAVAGAAALAAMPALAQSPHAKTALDPAGRVVCSSKLSATGVSSHTEGGRDFERYAGQVPPGLARRRAIDNWQLHVANACPSHSAKWWRARATHIACEGASGREYCTATAQPARKLLSFLWAY